MKKILIILGLFLIIPQIVFAQTSRNPCFLNGKTSTNGIPSCESVANTDPLPVTITGSGGSAGVVSNGSSGVAPTATNLPSASYNYLWNGATWDQAQGVSVGTAGIPATDVFTVQNPASNGTFPTASTPVGAVATGTTGSVVATIAATALVTNYLCEFDISAIGGTAAIGPVTVAGLTGGTRTYQFSSSAAGVNFSKSFNPCIPASAVNTAIIITTTADGTATAVDINSSGYRQ